MEQISSGVFGLVVGSVLGLTLSVLFEDSLKRGLSIVAVQVRQLRARGELPSPALEFRLGPVQTSLLILEGDGQQVIDEQSVRVLVDRSVVTLPDDIESLRREVQGEQERRRAEGLHAHWNGPIYAVVGLAVERIGIDESPGVCLRLRSTDYFAFLATQQLDRVLADGSTLREKYLDPYPVTSPPDFMSSSFGVYVAVVTADRTVVVARRSGDVGAFPGYWDASANEGLSRSLDSHGRTPPSLYDVARRGLYEELSLHRSEYRLELLAFDLDRSTNQWGCMFAAFTHEVTSAELADRRTRGVPDKWEHDEVEFVPFTVENMVIYLLRADRRGFWTPAAPALFYLTLVRQYGRVFVERHAARALRRLDLADRGHGYVAVPDRT